MEYAFEGDELTGEGRPSVFTSAIVKALETGEADRDQDSWISVRELYDYVLRRGPRDHAEPAAEHAQPPGGRAVRRAQPVGRAGDAAARTARRPREPVAAIREGAVNGLAELLRGRDRGLAEAARARLERRRRERRQPPREHRCRRRARAASPARIATTGRRRPGRDSAAARPTATRADDTASRRRPAPAAAGARPPPRRAHPTTLPLAAVPLRARPTPIRRPSPRLRGGVRRASPVALRGRAWILALVAGVLIMVGCFLPWRYGARGCRRSRRCRHGLDDQRRVRDPARGGRARRQSRSHCCSRDAAARAPVDPRLGRSSLCFAACGLGAVVAIVDSQGGERRATTAASSCGVPARPPDRRRIAWLALADDLHAAGAARDRPAT